MTCLWHLSKVANMETECRHVATHVHVCLCECVEPSLKMTCKDQVSRLQACFETLLFTVFSSTRQRPKPEHFRLWVLKLLKAEVYPSLIRTVFSWAVFLFLCGANVSQLSDCYSEPFMHQVFFFFVYLQEGKLTALPQAWPSLFRHFCKNRFFIYIFLFIDWKWFHFNA